MKQQSKPTKAKKKDIAADFFEDMTADEVEIPSWLKGHVEAEQAPQVVPEPVKIAPIPEPVIVFEPPIVVSEKIEVESKPEPSVVPPKSGTALKPIEDVEEKNGFLQIPHEIYEYIDNLNTKNQIKIYKKLVQFSLGFRKDHLEASYSWICREVGIKDQKTVIRVVKELLALGVIKIKEPADLKANRGTIYSVPKVTEYLDSKSNLKDPSGVKQPIGSSDLEPSGVPDPTPHWGAVPPIKERIKESSKKTLSSLVENHVQPSRRERVLGDLNFWKTKYSEEQIIQAFEYIEKNGMIGKPGLKIGDKFSYLLTVMDAAVKLSEKPAEQGNGSSQNSAKWAELEAKKEAEAKREEQELFETYRAFGEAFKNPNEKDQVLKKLFANYKTKFPDLQFIPDEALILYWDQIGRRVPEVTL